MSEELLQRDLIKNPKKIGTWDFYSIGSTTINNLKEAGIIRSIDYGDISRKKVDGIITKQKEVVAIIEYKSPKQFNTQEKKNKAILQEIQVAKKLNAKLIIATDTQETIWINAETGNIVKDENGNDLKYHFDLKDDNLQKFIISINQSISEKNDRILPKKLVDPTGLSKQIWQDVWSVSGATPENCLYTFVELFIFKYLSDLSILKGDFSFDELLKKYNNNEINDVLQHYANSIRPKIKDLFPEGIDKTTIINGTIFVSKDQKAVDGYGTVFKKVLEKFRDYGKLEHIDHDFKSKLFESFLKESISKKNWGQFFTPIKVVRAMNEMAKGELKDGMTICDPACGVGKFPLEYIKENLNKLFQIKDGKINQKVKMVGFDKGFDKDEQKTIILAKANMLIYFCELLKGNPDYTQEFAKLFNESFILKTNSILGTLSEPIENEYDLILTNPPYVTSGSSNLKEEIAKSTVLKNYYKINAMGVEGLFMEWIVKALKPQGKAFIVVPDGLLYRQDDELRKFLLDNCFIDAIISLPVKTFFTTQKKTYILAITKKEDISHVQTNPVFTYLVSEIGESRDINRLEIEENDLKEAVNLYNAFKGSKQYFSSINKDKRCKITPFEWFVKNVTKSWVIENLWNLKELNSFGLKKEDNILKINEFPVYLSGVTDNIISLQDQLETTNIEPCQYKSINILDPEFFEVVKGSIGMKKTEYARFDSKNTNDIPVYTATLQPVAFFKNGVVKKCPNIASSELPHISFANDGDGTAGTNIILHINKYYINTSRFVFKSVNKDISSEYIYFAIQDIKQKYEFNYSHKATLENIKKINILVPVNSQNEPDLQKQKEIAERYHKIEEVKNILSEELEKIKNIKVSILT